MSEILADAGIAHTVCVATEYGEIVMREQTESTKAMQTAHCCHAANSMC